jgi:hypothetical protein
VLEIIDIAEQLFFNRKDKDEIIKDDNYLNNTNEYNCLIIAECSG